LYKGAGDSKSYYTSNNRKLAESTITQVIHLAFAQFVTTKNCNKKYTISQIGLIFKKM